MRPKAIAAATIFSSISTHHTISARRSNLLAFGFQNPQNIGSYLSTSKETNRYLSNGATGRIIMNQFSNSVNDEIKNDTNSEDQNSHLFTLKKRNPYDVHVYYDGLEERQAAMELRQKMQEKFQWMRFYAPKDRPIGPHPVPMWEADFGSYENRNLWKDVCEFVNEEHGDLSVLIHPHSLDGDYADHTKNSFWAGEVKDLRIQGWKR